MPLPSGTFSDTASGRLQVVFRGRWGIDGAEWPSDTAADLILRAYLGTGETRQTALLHAGSATAFLERDYTAGTELAVGMEYVGHEFDGEAELCATDLQISCYVVPVTTTQAITFEALLAYLRAELLPMGEVPYAPPGSDDTDGDEWFVRPLPELATLLRPGPDPLGYLNDLGRATITDPDGYQIWEASCIAVSYRDAVGTDPRPMVAEVLPGGTQVRISGGYTPDENGGNVGRWFMSYFAAPNGSGTSLADPWAGLNNVQWGSVAPGDTVWVVGLHDDAQLNIQASGTPGAYIKIRLDHPSAAGIIYQSRIIPAAAWTAEPNGEYGLADVTTANNMVFEDKRRVVGPSVTSKCKARVYEINAVANTLEVAGERAIFTGMPLHIPQDVSATALPTGLQFAPERGVPYYAILVAVVSGRYVIRLADTVADAMAGTAVDLLDAGAGGNLFVWVTSATHADPLPGTLKPGQFGYSPVEQKLYYKPTWGTPASHELRISNDKDGRSGSCIVAPGRQFVRILGGGQYGGLFAFAASNPLPAPKGQVGLAHLNAVYFEGGNDIIVDGLEIFSARSGVVFNGTVRGTHRNSRVRDMGWHATGGETVVTAERYMLQERLWVSDIGLNHDYGDCQALVTNPGSTRATFRRCFVQRNGRDSRYVNNGSSVADSSEEVAVYRCWFDDCVGEVFECGSGTDGAVMRPHFLSNIITRNNLRTNSAGQPEHVRRPVVGLYCVGTYDMRDGLFAGNLMARSVFEPSVFFPAEPNAVLVARSANTAARNDGHTFTRNAVFGCEGPVYAVKTLGTVPNTPSFSADENLFVGLTDFYLQDLSGGPDISYDANHVLGSEAGFWSFDTGNDTGSQIGMPQNLRRNAAPTTEQLEFLRQDDAWDNAALPTLEQIGAYPLPPT